MGQKVSHLVFGIAAAAPLGWWTSDALGQTYTVVSIAVAGTAGTLVSGASNVTVTLSPSGSFSPAIYQRSPSTVTYKVSVQCVNGAGVANRCSTSKTFAVVVHDTGGTAGSRISPLQNFTLGNSSQTVSSGPSGSSTTTFVLSGMATNSATGTFQLGFDVPLLSTGSTGSTATRSFVVSAGQTPTSLQSSMSSTLSTKVWNPMAVSVLSNMDFGKIVRPSSGSGTVTLTSSGVTTSAGVVLGITHTLASFRVTGEGAQAFSLTVPSSFNMISSGHTLTVTTTPSFVSTSSLTTQSFSNALGTLGSFAFTVGGHFPIAATTFNGAYVGNLVVTVQYN